MNDTPRRPGWLKRQSRIAASSVAYHDPETELRIRGFLRDLDMNFDCDAQGRTHAPYCRACEAKAILAVINGGEADACTT